MNEIKLYRKNAIGMGTWRIWQENDVLHYSHAVTETASEVFHHDTVKLNNSGRSLQQQIDLEMKSRINRQLDKGYKATRAEAETGVTNQMGFVTPMLAQSLRDVPNTRFAYAHVQPKYDGHRCMITNFRGDILAYTRKGKPITTISHIINDFHWLPEGKTVDGELYIHGKKLQSISSLIKRQQTGSENLHYHWYDYVSTQWFDKRYAAMVHACGMFKMDHVQLVPTHMVTDIGQAYDWFGRFRQEGYEGAMLRLSSGGYSDGRRASQLLKMKEREDCEVTVVGVAA